LPRLRPPAPHPLMEVTHEQLRDALRAARYLTTPRVETALFLALVLEKPLLAEGPAGAGKTELAKVLAEMLRTDLVRLQCYEGLDEARALFEWNYQKQLLRIQTDRAEGRGWDEVSHHIFSREFLLDRPLLHAIKVPELDERLRVQVARFVAGLRKLELRKAPSIAETLDWARGLCALGVRELDPATVRQTLALVVKHEEDLRKAEGKVSTLLAAA